MMNPREFKRLLDEYVNAVRSGHLSRASRLRTSIIREYEELWDFFTNNPL